MKSIIRRILHSARFVFAATMLAVAAFGIALAGDYRTDIQQWRSFSVSFTPAATPAAIGTTGQNLVVTGVVVGDKLFMQGPTPTSLCPAVGALVGSANNVTVFFTTLTAVACTPASGTYKFLAVRN